VARLGGRGRKRPSTIGEEERLSTIGEEERLSTIGEEEGGSPK